MTRSFTIGGLTLAALLTALAIALWPASNTDKSRSDGEALGAAVTALNEADTQVGAYGTATADDELTSDIYECELETAVNDLNDNATDFREEGPEVQQAFWEGYETATA